MEVIVIKVQGHQEMISNLEITNLLIQEINRIMETNTRIITILASTINLKIIQAVPQRNIKFKRINRREKDR
jgi:hypothetical protein